MAKIATYVNTILDAGAHYYWVRFNDAGQIVAQLNGFASKDGKEPTDWAISGKLIATELRGMDTNLALTSKVVYESNEYDIATTWKVGVDLAAAINEQKYDYNVWDSWGGRNSNAVYSTLGAGMKLPMVNLTGSLTLQPGFGDTGLLPASTVERIFKNVMDTAYGGGGGGSADPHPGGGGTGGGGGGAGGSGGEDPPEEEGPGASHFVAPHHEVQEIQLVGIHHAFSHM